jgi:hypothetical protein
LRVCVWCIRVAGAQAGLSSASLPLVTIPIEAGAVRGGPRTGPEGADDSSADMGRHRIGCRSHRRGASARPSSVTGCAISMACNPWRGGPLALRANRCRVVGLPGSSSRGTWDMVDGGWRMVACTGINMRRNSLPGPAIVEPFWKIPVLAPAAALPQHHRVRQCSPLRPIRLGLPFALLASM